MGDLETELMADTVLYRSVVRNTALGLAGPASDGGETGQRTSEL